MAFVTCNAEMHHSFCDGVCNVYGNCSDGRLVLCSSRLGSMPLHPRSTKRIHLVTLQAQTPSMYPLVSDIGLSANRKPRHEAGSVIIRDEVDYASASTLETWTADQLPPRGAGMPRSLSVPAIPARVVTPSAWTSWIT